jgi:hypothetical protein
MEVIFIMRDGRNKFKKLALKCHEKRPFWRLSHRWQHTEVDL